MLRNTSKRLIVIVCGTALLIVAAIGVAALRNCQHPPTPPEVLAAQTPAEVRVKAVERKSTTVIQKGLFVNSYVDGLVDKCKKEAKYE